MEGLWKAPRLQPLNPIFHVVAFNRDEPSNDYPGLGRPKDAGYVLQSATTPNHFTNSQLNNIMFAQSGMSVNTLYQENSFGSVSFAGDVIGPFTITVPTTCDTSNVDSQADHAATAAGTDLSLYQHRVYMLPNKMSPICTWCGLSNLGGSQTNSWIDTGAMGRLTLTCMGFSSTNSVMC